MLQNFADLTKYNDDMHLDLIIQIDRSKTAKYVPTRVQGSQTCTYTR